MLSYTYTELFRSRSVIGEKVRIVDGEEDERRREGEGRMFDLMSILLLSNKDKRNLLHSSVEKIGTAGDGGSPIGLLRIVSNKMLGLRQLLDTRLEE